MYGCPTGIPIVDENKSCKVVLTSRNRDVWKNMDVHEDFKIDILSEQESWALFKKKVGNYVDAHDELREIAWAICKECQGLPVTIIALGVALKGKDMDAWQDALDKLKNSMLKDIEGINPKVYASLKWSYDRLDSEDAKSCFLLCCLFPEDARIPIDDLVRYYMAGRTFHRDQKPDSFERALYRVRTVIGTLLSCCLLLDETYSEDVVKMHDVVRDVAISIAKGEKLFLIKHGVKDWPEKANYEHCLVISLRPHNMREFPDELVCPALHTLRLGCTGDKSRLQVPDRFFSRTENLTVLDLNGVTMSPLLPASLAKLAKLQMLCLDGCELGDIAILKDLKDHLEILSLRRSNIEVLPPEVGELTRLRLLDMQDCNLLRMISKGVISKLFCLEELFLPWGSSRLWEGTRAETGRNISGVALDELRELTRLTTLSCVRIRDPTLLPKGFTFENLVRFNISVGEKASCSYDKDSTGILKLENIHLANTLEGLLGKPQWCRQRNGLYPSKSFNHLTYLSVKDCRNLKYLFSPSSARGLVRLKKLEIERCIDMEGVIGNEGEKDEDSMITLSLLNDLKLEGLPNLISFYPKKEKTAATSSESFSAHAQTVLFTDKVAFPALERLSISALPNITDIWDKKLRPAESFCKLRDLDVSSCSKLVNLVQSTMLPLRNLKSLRLQSCPMVGGVINLEKREEETQEAANNTIVPFPELRTMKLGDLENIKGFCTFRSEKQTVFHAQVESCFGVREIFHIDGLEVGEGQDQCIWPLTQIRNIGLSNLPQLTCLWNKDPHGLLGLQSLKYLTIENCPLLRNLLTVSVAKALGGLKVLYLISCSTMEEVIATDEGHKEVIVDQEIVFPELRRLVLEDLPNLKCFCSLNYNFSLPSLERGVLAGCPNMQTFTSGSVRMPPTIFTTERNAGLVIEDLNKHLEQRHLK
ncbi:hypothetical protein RHGRI_009977 [Rhododendron griersonianum]|uniref:NB-ARC domain-containing protein n=1 Tax=Rhododendron griersonianum TaxID=479676 RepID=A0AAV6KH32_9ERIC|nr:hypothetical protein RHGRI_009977 [Rhododendron griersonianum]